MSGWATRGQRLVIGSSPGWALKFQKLGLPRAVLQVTAFPPQPRSQSRAQVQGLSGPQDASPALRHPRLSHCSLHTGPPLGHGQRGGLAPPLWRLQQCPSRVSTPLRGSLRGQCCCPRLQAGCDPPEAPPFPPRALETWVGQVPQQQLWSFRLGFPASPPLSARGMHGCQTLARVPPHAAGKMPGHSCRVAGAREAHC